MATPTDTVAAVVGTAQGLGVDPLIALADILREDTSFNPGVVVTDSNGLPSVGLFQLNAAGELQSVPGSTLAQKIAGAQNPITNAGVALSRFAAVQKSSPGLDPGALAAAAENPADKPAYAADVNAKYQALKANVGEPPPAGSSGFTGWLKKAWGFLSGQGAKVSPLAPMAGLQAADNAAVAAGTGALSGIASGIAQDALKVGLEIVFVLAGLALLIFGLTRMFPGVTRTVTSTVGSGARLGALAAA